MLRPEMYATPEALSVDTDANTEFATIHSLSDDTLLLALSLTNFASLLALKLVNRRLRKMAQATLSSCSAWVTARGLFKPITCSAREVANTTSPCVKGLAADFIAALRGDDIQTVEVLLHLGHFSARQPVPSTAEVQNGEGAFPLHFAHSAAMVALLCSYDADVDVRCGDDSTPVMLSYDYVRCGDGLTPLMLAASAGEVAVVRALCEHGANVHLRSGDRRPELVAIHQAENCDLRIHFLRTTQPPEESLWRFPSGGMPARPRPDGAACVRVLLQFGATRIL